MLQQLMQGWKIVSFNRRTFLLISLYQLFWTALLYIIINQLVTPILRVLPTKEVSDIASQYFWLEARFLVAKTDLVVPYLYLFAALLLIRMIISPFIQSGAFGTLARSRQEGGNNSFISEIKQGWKPFVILYWTKAIAIFVPIIMVTFPIIKPLIANYFTLPAGGISITHVALLFIWCILISFIIYGILIGKVNQLSWQKSLALLIKRALKLLGSALIIMSLALVIQAIFQLTFPLIIGVMSTIMFFILPIVRTFLKAWTVSTHIVQLEQ